ncbi:DUF5058 domain-containing protein [Alteribacter lacisalsi]|uniref:DUF5058 domain-containing protein n=1 Tax=Alteribacter lacisalsi TaxID=2045244 RepID=A0A2W0HGG4_9BACI|nr:DUF5058 family protein [Alteribacter lacisalsi]PYZ95982.1 DUF5058 domain-containing protein [Alteribacter lacisalsi]
MEEVLRTANSTPFWIMAFIFVGIVAFQAIVFLRIAKESAPDAGLSETEVKTAIRTGLISSIGPSFGIAIVLVSLIALIGSPLTLIRIGIIGSAATESSAAVIGANAFGMELNSPDFTLQAFSAVVWTMCIGGMGWLIFTALFTKRLGATQSKIEKKNPKAMAIISLAAMLGAFAFLASQQMINSANHVIAGVAAIATMIILMKTADRKHIAWLKEWALGISIVVGMTAAYFTTLI